VSNLCGEAANCVVGQVFQWAMVGREVDPLSLSRPSCRIRPATDDLSASIELAGAKASPSDIGLENDTGLSSQTS
jgi:hypothetical protein